MSESEKESARELRLQVKKMILKTINIKDVEPQEIDDAEMIFESERLGLDSLDGLELVVAIQKEFGVAITDQSHALTILQTVNSIAAFVEEQKKQQVAASPTS
jgi:acyl carrier protein